MDMNIVAIFYGILGVIHHIAAEITFSYTLPRDELVPAMRSLAKFADCHENASINNDYYLSFIINRPTNSCNASTILQKESIVDFIEKSIMKPVYVLTTNRGITNYPTCIQSINEDSSSLTASNYKNSYSTTTNPTTTNPTTTNPTTTNPTTTNPTTTNPTTTNPTTTNPTTTNPTTTNPTTTNPTTTNATTTNPTTTNLTTTNPTTTNPTTTNPTTTNPTDANPTKKYEEIPLPMAPNGSSIPIDNTSKERPVFTTTPSPIQEKLKKEKKERNNRLATIITGVLVGLMVAAIVGCAIAQYIKTLQQSGAYVVSNP